MLLTNVESNVINFFLLKLKMLNNLILKPILIAKFKTEKAVYKPGRFLHLLSFLNRIVFFGEV